VPPDVVVNGSPLWPPVTGVQRVARGLTARLLVEAAPGAVRVLGGPGTAGGSLERFPGGRLARLAWEQTVLPAAAAGVPIVNLGNLSPLAGRHNLVLTYDLHTLHAPGDYRRGVAPVYWRLTRASYRRARVRMTLSRTVAEELEATLGGNVDAVVPPGIDDAFRPRPPAEVEAVRRRFRLGGPYLVFVGWAQPSKRASLAIAAHRAVVADVPHTLVVVGAARPDYPVPTLPPAGPTVVMTGRLNDRDLAAVYTGSAGLLFPSTHEGFGLPPVEALACGAPVAASSLPVLQEVLGGLPGATIVGSGTVPAWAEAAAALLAADGSRPERSAAALARYPWEGKGRLLFDLALELAGR
jgi:glycosyltransferase involved in cell wall biosynthesis